MLSAELATDLLLIDERLGWSVAQRKGIRTVGLLGCLVKAKEQGIIQQIKPVIEELRAKAGFWVGDKLVARVLKMVNE